MSEFIYIAGNLSRNVYTLEQFFKKNEKAKHPNRKNSIPSRDL